MVLRGTVGLAALAFGALACGGDAGAVGPDTRTQVTRTASDPTASSPSAVPPVPRRSSTAAPSASATTGIAQAGTWSGKYKAVKDSVYVPDKVPYHAGWAKDDGASAVGPGSLELRIAPDGEVTGTAEGALGDQVIRGVLEGDTLRAGLSPRDPRGTPSMTGILTAAVKGDKLVGELQVASPEANWVRSAPIELERK